jgi:methionine-rich copper-binding protein CopC
MKFRLAIAAIFASIAVSSLSTAVFAHSRPVRFDPPPGAVLTSAPAQVNGWFDSAFRSDPNWTFIHVADAQGNRVDTGTTTLSSSRQQLTAPLKSGLGPGAYTVTYRTWDDDDGAIFGDCFNFFVGQAAADAAQSAPTRLDAGGNCARIDIENPDKVSTPDPSVASDLTKAASAGTAADFTAASESSSGSGGNKVPWWTLILAVGAGLVAGAVGGRLVKTGR